jgi:hypothetical protein
MYHQVEMGKPKQSRSQPTPPQIGDGIFTDALRKIATAGAASSRVAIQAAKATKPSLHTRFVYGPAKDRT